MGYFGIPFRNGVPIGLGSVVSFGAQQFDPSELFVGGTAGAWYDPSDLTTLFTTSAGTTQCAMPGQGSAVSVGRMLDKSGNGNHAIAFNNTTARPELRARVNLLTYSEEFDNGAWTKGVAVVVANQATAPDGTLTADLLRGNAAYGYQWVYWNNPPGVTANTAYTITVYAKAAGYSWLWLSDVSGGGSLGDAYFNLQSGTVGTVTGGASASIVAVNNGWYRCSMTGLSPDAIIAPSVAFTSADNTPLFIPNNTDGIYIWGADLRPANIGANVPAYQRIADANTYDTTGFPLYLRFDGIDDSMYTPANLNLSGTDKATVFAGVRKLSDAAQGAVAELSATIASNNGAFLLSAPNSAAANYNFSSKGTTQVDNTVITYAAPNTAVLSGAADITAPSNILRVNAVQAGSVGTSQGTGNFGTYPLYIGSRNNASLRFNGQIYSLIIAGSAVSAGNISATEQWVANKTGIVIP